MAIINEVSQDEKYRVTLNTDNGDAEVNNLTDGTWFGGHLSEESREIVAPLVVPGFENGNVLYAIGYYIASKISGGSSAK